MYEYIYQIFNTVVIEKFYIKFITVRYKNLYWKNIYNAFGMERKTVDIKEGSNAIGKWVYIGTSAWFWRKSQGHKWPLAAEKLKPRPGNVLK